MLELAQMKHLGFGFHHNPVNIFPFPLQDQERNVHFYDGRMTTALVSRSCLPDPACTGLRRTLSCDWSDGDGDYLLPDI